MKAALGRLLNSFGLLLPVLRGIEFMQTLGVEKVADAPDGLPLPPASLRIRVVGTTDVAWFLERGCILERAIREALLRAGAPLELGPGDPRLRLRMRVCAATLAGLRRTGLRHGP